MKLLRVLQNREIERVGETKSRSVDVRLVAATNADLEERVRKGTFREDFYFRLKVVTLRMPPLRERRRDIPPWPSTSVPLYAERHGRDVPDDRTDDAMELLVAYDWPGNVRELENVIEAAVVLAEGDDDHGRRAARSRSGGDSASRTCRTATGSASRRARPCPRRSAASSSTRCERTDGNKTAAARILGIGLRTLYRKLEQYEAQDGRRRRGE